MVDTLKTQVISTAKPETSDKTPKIIEKPTSVINSRKTNHDIAKNSVGNVKWTSAGTKHDNSPKAVINISQRLLLLFYIWSKNF